MAGRRIVEMVKENLTMSKILTKQAFENAIRVNGAIGGSTNAVIHLLAIAGRVGVPLTLDDWDKYGRDVPTVVDLKPSGRFLMEDFHYAGGLPAVIRTLGEAGLLNREAMTVNGKTIWENCNDAPRWNTEVIRPIDKPLAASGGIAVLRGNLAPDGAVIKPSAASPQLMKHRGRAIVFDTIEQYKARINDPALNADASCVLVLRNSGPVGYPGMAEVGNMGLPPKILKKGITDMVRISDARMSGTAYGTVVLHACPEAAAGGPLAFVRNGDMVELDVEARRLHLEVTDAELARRRAAWEPPPPAMTSGYQKMYIDHVMQASEGADLDFLRGCRGAAIPRESH
jgi:dihydroxyacid dehydratase/phosphogluconate dehydratase